MCRLRSNWIRGKDKRLNNFNQRPDLLLGGGIDGIQPVRARQVIPDPRLRLDVLELKGDDSQFAVGCQTKFPGDVVRRVHIG